MAAYPKVCGDKVTFAEYNCVKCNINSVQQVLETELENTINLDKLLYCKTLASIPHDYVVVDSFTDSTGYNNTILTCCTTSTYVSSALNGHYTNLFSTTSCPNYSTLTCCIINVGGCACVVFSDYSLLTRAYTADSNTGTAYGSMCICSTFMPTFSSYDYICFNIQCYISTNTYSCACVAITDSHDNVSCAIFCEGTSTLNVTNCYAYCKLSTNCYCFYCNGTGKCQVTMSAFPNIKFIACSREQGHGNTCSNLVMSSFYAHYKIESKIVLVPMSYSSTIKGVYLTTEKYGVGTIVYNVIDSSTGCCIATNIPINCVYMLPCCVCCHTYEIIQCSGDVSCIKSYAIAVGI